MTASPHHLSAVPVDLVGVGRAFGTRAERRVVLRDVDLHVEAGEVVALLGASGCGKSTLLRLVGGLDLPSAGEVRLDGVTVTGIDHRAAVVFQEPRLLPWRTVAENVSLGLPDGTARDDGRAEVARALETVGLADAARRRPREISGGMAQRAALARALVRRPGVLLLDEPFAALDALTRLRMQDLVDDLQRSSGATVLLVTHDVDEALTLADRVVVLGPVDDRAGATVAHHLTVPTPRPRDRADRALADLRVDLLDRLGVPRHTTTSV